jgi:acyl-CoA reductase-like NAD-dependent aldehyde dehydrogenase
VNLSVFATIHTQLNSPVTLQAPFGGYKGSGIGRENDQYGVESFLEVKTVVISGF